VKKINLLHTLSLCSLIIFFIHGMDNENNTPEYVAQNTQTGLINRAFNWMTGKNYKEKIYMHIDNDLVLINKSNKLLLNCDVMKATEEILSSLNATQLNNQKTTQYINELDLILHIVDKNTLCLANEIRNKIINQVTKNMQNVLHKQLFPELILSYNTYAQLDQIRTRTKNNKLNPNKNPKDNRHNIDFFDKSTKQTSNN